MDSWEPSPKNRFLKAVGSSDDPMAADWMDSAPQEMTTIHFSKRPASVRVDDYLVYYATGWQKVIGIVQVFTKPDPRCAVEALALLGHCPTETDDPRLRASSRYRSAQHRGRT